MMDNNEALTLAFLADMDIEAEFRLMETLERLIAIKAVDYQQHRQWVEAWFTLVEQDADYCYLRERLRGTGNTL